MVEFKTSDNFPWLIFNSETYGFDADLVAQELEEKGFIRIYNDGTENVLKALRDLIQLIINNSYEYQEIRDAAKRFQIIINGNILEIYLNRTGCFVRNSDSKWLFNGTYEVGTDFTGHAGTKVEAKVYYSFESMSQKMKDANLGNERIFHGADLVCCYLINTCTYQWLQRSGNQYEVSNDEQLRAWTSKHLPPILPLCRCVENKETDEWELKPLYNFYN